MVSIAPRRITTTSLSKPYGLGLKIGQAAIAKIWYMVVYPPLLLAMSPAAERTPAALSFRTSARRRALRPTGPRRRAGSSFAALRANRAAIWATASWAA